MSDWIQLAVYVVGFLFTYRKAFPALVDGMFDGAPLESSERGAVAILTMLACLLWPLVLLGWGLYRLGTPVTPGERRAELDARQRRIEQLERELGIDS